MFHYQVKPQQFDLQLPNNLEAEKHPLKGVTWHGLSKNEPLVLEQLIRDCLSNPYRKKFPDFFRKRNLEACALSYEIDSPEYFFAKIKPELSTKFNNRKILLHDTAKFNKRAIDEAPYLEAIRKQRWCGPYKHVTYDWF